MVFFTCGGCNESLKKNQVEKHLYKCRRCQYLSCIDCGQEFWGDSYQSHTKCISEEEKYSGKNYVAKPNKGEVKQEQWIQKVQAAIQKAPTNPQLKNLLQRLQEYPNIPRKKTKFENFLKCSLRVLNKGLVDQVWDLLMAEAKQQNGSSTTTNADSESKPPPPPQPSETDGEAARTAESADPEAEETEKKLSKRERKEQRQKKVHKSEKKDRQAAADEEEDAGKKKKGKRRKREEEEEEEEEKESSEVASEPKKKRRKGENGVAMDTQEAAEENGAGGDDSQDAAQPLSEKKGKFSWGQTITAVLEAKGEINLKKLQKKVLSEYASYGSSKPDDRLQAKFHKKLSKLPNVRVLKDRARLLAS